MPTKKTTTKRSTTKRESTENQKAIEGLINEGIEKMVEANPRFANYKGYFLRHADIEGVEKKFNEIYEANKENGYNSQAARKKAISETRNYIISGSMLDEKGKKAILEQGSVLLFDEKAERLMEREGRLEKNLFQKMISPFKKTEGTDYLDRTTETFNELLHIIKEGGYKVPEIEKPLVKLHYLGFASPAIALLAQAELIDKKKERYLLKNLYETYKQNTKEVVSGIEKYVVPQKIAAAVMGFIGTFLLIFNLNITGAVIGGDSNITMGILGVFMIFFALMLYLRPLKKSFKK